MVKRNKIAYMRDVYRSWITETKQTREKVDGCKLRIFVTHFFLTFEGSPFFYHAIFDHFEYFS